MLKQGKNSTFPEEIGDFFSWSLHTNHDLTWESTRGRWRDGKWGILFMSVSYKATQTNHDSGFYSLIFCIFFRPIRTGPGSGHSQPCGRLLRCHGAAAAGVARLPQTRELAAPLGSSTASLLRLSSPRRRLDPSVTAEGLPPATLIESLPK